MRKKLGELLIEAGSASAEDIVQALVRQRAAAKGPVDARLRLGELLVRAGVVTPKQVAHALAAQWDLPFVELPEIPGEVSRLVPVEVQAAHGIVPFRIEHEGKTERVHVAIADPRTLAHVEELRFQLGKPLRIFLAARDDLDDVLGALKGEVSEEFEINEDEDIDLSDVALAPTPASALTRTLTLGLPPPPGATRLVAKELDALLGKTEPSEPAEPPPTPERPQPQPPPPQKVEVIRFAPPSPKPEPDPLSGLSEDDLRILEDLERMATGEAPLLETEKVRPAQMVAALIRLLIRKNVIAEADFLEELGRK